MQCDFYRDYHENMEARMPRTARLDFPGALHHVIGRGIERRFIFEATVDKAFFVEKLTELCGRYDFRCYAWCLMGNHFHLLLETGSFPLKKLMSGLLTSYALHYNRRCHRVGHVFQNRYHSVLCEKESYSLELIRYIHLNPVKANMCDLSDLKKYRWCGHQELMSRNKESLIDANYVLGLFSNNRNNAISHYLKFMGAGIAESQYFDGGGLMRNLAAQGIDVSDMRHEQRINYDQRILGDGEFVEQVISKTDESTNGDWNVKKIKFEELAAKVKTYYGVEYEELFSNRRSHPYREARSVLIYLADRYCNLENQRQLGKLFEIKRSAVSMAVKRGFEICRKNSIEEAILAH